MKMIGIFVAVFVLLLGFAVVRAMSTGKKAPVSGAPAPDFTLNSQDGKPLSLHDLRGKWVVLYFYPKDFTSGCTREAHNFQRDLAQYEQKNAIILGADVVFAAQEVQAECAATGEIDTGCCFGNLGIGKDRAAADFDIRNEAASRGERPLEGERIYPHAVSG